MTKSSSHLRNEAEWRGFLVELEDDVRRAEEAAILSFFAQPSQPSQQPSQPWQRASSLGDLSLDQSPLLPPPRRSASLPSSIGRPQSALRRGRFGRHSADETSLFFADVFPEQQQQRRLRFDTPTVYHLAEDGRLERIDVSWRTSGKKTRKAASKPLRRRRTPAPAAAPPSAARKEKDDRNFADRNLADFNLNFAEQYLVVTEPRELSTSVLLPPPPPPCRTLPRRRRRSSGGGSDDFAAQFLVVPAARAKEPGEPSSSASAAAAMSERRTSDYFDVQFVAV